MSAVLPATAMTPAGVSPAPGLPERSPLFAICTAMTSTLELDPLLNLILELTMKELRADRGSILLYDPASDTLRMLASRGMPEAVARQGYIPRKGSIAEWVMREDQPLLLNDDVNDARFSSIAESVLRSSLCSPLRSRGRVIGTLNVSRERAAGERGTGRGKGRGYFTEADLETLVILATQAAVAIENARLMEENVRNARLAAIGQTVSSISHCVKNMLTNLKGGHSLCEKGVEDKDWETTASGLNMLERAVNRISLLILDMLDYSKPRPASRAPAAILPLLEEVAAVIAQAAEQKRVTVSIDAPNSLPRLGVDGDRLFRALLNLATNAIEAIETGDGRVTIAARLLAPGDPAALPAPPDLEGDVATAVLSAVDNGCGIDPALHETIFEPFYSAKGSKGTGIGLAVTRKIALEHGGKVEVESAPGRGTTMRLLIPCTLCGEAPA